MREQVDILGVKVDKVTMEQAIEQIKLFLCKDFVHTIYTPNSEIIMDAQKDIELKEILNSSDLVIADGSGVVLASKILKTKLPEKVSGIDLVKKSFLTDEKPSYFFFGGKPGIAEKAKLNIEKEYSQINIVGIHDGYFNEEDNSIIISQINSSGADILLVALGAPKQEKWIAENKDKLNVKICIGVGGTLDIFAGVQKLAPDFFRNHGLEWFYRLVKNPGRFVRMLKLPRFIFKVIIKKLFKSGN